MLNKEETNVIDIKKFFKRELDHDLNGVDEEELKETITKDLENLDAKSFFIRESKAMVDNQEEFEKFYNALPKGPNLKLGDKVKVLKVHDSFLAVEENADPLLLAASKKVEQLNQAVVEHCYHRGDLAHLFAGLSVFGRLMGSKNQFIFNVLVGPEKTAYVPVELDLPLTQTVFMCSIPDGQDHDVQAGDEVVVSDIITIKDLKHYFDVQQLIEIMAEHMGVEPEEDGMYSPKQLQDLLDFAEILGFIQPVA